MWTPALIVLFALLPLLCRGTVFPDGIVPVRYDIQIQLPTTSKQDPLIPAFIGYVQIDFTLTKLLRSRDQYASYRRTKMHLESYQVPKSGVSFALDAANLTNFENVTLEHGGHKIKVANIKLLKEKAVFFLAENTLNPGKYSLRIERYSGVITYDQGVFYREAGDNPVLATQLFPRNARSVFPCVDDIGAKATFKVSLIHPHQTIAISSTISEESPSSLNVNWKMTKFVETAPIAPHMLAFAVLPIEYAQITTRSKLPINIFSNRLELEGTLAFELANLTGQIYDDVSHILSDSLPLSQLNILLIDNIKTSRSYGLFTIDYNALSKADHTYKVYMITRAIVQQWFGGVISVPVWQEFCIQDDIAEYVTEKVMRNIIKNKETYELFRLSSYLKVQLAETFFAPGETVYLSQVTPSQMASRCGLKGAVALESLETVVGELNVLLTIRKLIDTFKHRPFQFKDFAQSFSGFRVDKNASVAMVLDFWDHNGGQPLLSVSKNGTLISMKQLNNGRQAKTTSNMWSSMPVWPLRIELAETSLPFNFMISQALDIAPINDSLLPLVNLGYHNHYRVNYDENIWDSILQKMASPALNNFSPRMRAQLVGDFCYFKSLNLIDKSKAEDLRQGFLQILRRHVDSFPLCEFYAFWCVGGHQKRISLKKERKLLMEEHIESTFASFGSQTEYGCGANLRPTQAASKLCHLAFGTDCM
uniref:Peptidase_M1 domain-containing protein n=1 Tax=Steinernema glaseri TaxID=37863 RepID=A0A1I7Z455_9BILA